MARCARQEDKQALRDLWKLCFGDPEPFLDWFFTDRYLPQFCSVGERDGKVVAAAHAVPFYVSMRGKPVTAAVVGGVSTEPDYRKQGLKHEVMTHYMNNMRKYGMALIPYRPAHLPTFFSIGHYPVSDSRYVTLTAEAARPETDDCKEVKIEENYDSLYLCYQRFAQRYSGMLLRTYADMMLKCRDYLSCNARCLIVEKDEMVSGYCIYFETDTEVIGEECAAWEVETYEKLLQGMARRSAGKLLTVRTPGDVTAIIPGAEAEVVPRSVMGVANVSVMLASLGLAGGAIEVLDHVVKENNGVFDLSGNLTDAAPMLRIPVGRLAQWAVGYRTLAEIINAGEAEVLDAAIVSQMDALGKCPCYIIDEY